MNTVTPTTPALSAASRAVVALFHDELAAVRFPDVDAETVAASYEAVSEAHSRVFEARRVLEAAMAEEATAQEALERLSQRALGYLRIYAEGRPELAARLAEAAGPTKEARRVEHELPKKRGRKAGIAQLDIVAAEDRPSSPNGPESEEIQAAE